MIRTSPETGVQREDDNKRRKSNSGLNEPKASKEEWYFNCARKPEIRYDVKVHEEYTTYTPLPPSPVPSLACDKGSENVKGKTWGDIMDEEDKLREMNKGTNDCRTSSVDINGGQICNRSLEKNDRKSFNKPLEASGRPAFDRYREANDRKPFNKQLETNGRPAFDRPREINNIRSFDKPPEAHHKPAIDRSLKMNDRQPFNKHLETDGIPTIDRSRETNDKRLNNKPQSTNGRPAFDRSRHMNVRQSINKPLETNGRPHFDRSRSQERNDRRTSNKHLGTNGRPVFNRPQETNVRRPFNKDLETDGILAFDRSRSLETNDRRPYGKPGERYGKQTSHGPLEISNRGICDNIAKFSNKENQDSRGVRKDGYRRAVAPPLETDENRLRTRQRQLDIGKETEGYKKYIAEVKRKDRTIDHPRTPNKYKQCSTRSWQGSVRVWRRKLHFWDPPSVLESKEKKFCDVSPDFWFQKCSDDESLGSEEQIMTENEPNENGEISLNQATLSQELDLGNEEITEEMLFSTHV